MINEPIFSYLLCLGISIFFFIMFEKSKIEGDRRFYIVMFLTFLGFQFLVLNWDFHRDEWHYRINHRNAIVELLMATEILVFSAYYSIIKEDKGWTVLMIMALGSILLKIYQ